VIIKKVLSPAAVRPLNKGRVTVCAVRLTLVALLRNRVVLAEAGVTLAVANRMATATNPITIILISNPL
jgi:hypothetical protein